MFSFSRSSRQYCFRINSEYETNYREICLFCDIFFCHWHRRYIASYNRFLDLEGRDAVAGRSPGHLACGCGGNAGRLRTSVAAPGTRTSSTSSNRYAMPPGALPLTGQTTSSAGRHLRRIPIEAGNRWRACSHRTAAMLNCGEGLLRNSRAWIFLLGLLFGPVIVRTGRQDFRSTCCRGQCYGKAYRKGNPLPAICRARGCRTMVADRRPV